MNTAKTCAKRKNDSARLTKSKRKRRADRATVRNSANVAVGQCLAQPCSTYFGDPERWIEPIGGCRLDRKQSGTICLAYEWLHRYNRNSGPCEYIIGHKPRSRPAVLYRIQTTTLEELTEHLAPRNLAATAHGECVPSMFRRKDIWSAWALVWGIRGFVMVMLSVFLVCVLVLSFTRRPRTTVDFSRGGRINKLNGG